MISFSLVCSDGHAFQGWFANSDAFDRQQAEGALSCPICGDGSVRKALMAPTIATARKRDSVKVAAHVPENGVEAVAALRKIREHLTENADYVGRKFAEEARKIHYDEAEKRGIYGEATSDEVRSLVDEGIDFHPLPVLPEDHN
jgi:hypothetical protein